MKEEEGVKLREGKVCNGRNKEGWRLELDGREEWEGLAKRTRKL